MVGSPIKIISCSGWSVVAADTPFEPVEGDPTLFRKELIYPGKFTKRTKDGNVEFELFVDDLAMDHWENQFNEMKKAGVEVPLAKGHTTDPELRRGTVQSIKKEPNPARGTNSLFLYGKFRDQNAAQMAKTSGVSLFSEPVFFDGRGHEYNHAITHVALTDRPLIPGLSGWQAIAASLPGAFLCEDQAPPAAPAPTPAPAPSVQDDSMTPLQNLATMMGIDFPPGTSDEDLTAMILAAWTAEETAEGDDPTAIVDDPSLVPASLAGDPGCGPGGMPGEKKPNPFGGAPASLAASLDTAIAATQTARKTQLESLVMVGKITPAERDQYVKTYAGKERVAFALSHGEFGDGFDGVMLALSNREPKLRGEKTSHQHVPEAPNPLIADAEKRAKASQR